MRRGTRVGQAYVAVTADGSGINEEIVDSVEGVDLGSAGNDKGREFGESFGDSADESLTERLDKIFDKIADNLDKTLSEKFDRIGKNLGRNLSRNITKSIGTDLVDRLDSQFAELFDNLDNRLAAVGKQARTVSAPVSGNQTPNAPQTLYKSYDFASMFEAARIKLHKNANDAIAKDDADLVKAQEKLLDSIYKGEKAKADFLGRFEAARAKLHEASNSVIAKADAELAKSQQALYDRLQKESIRRSSVDNDTERLGDRLSGFLGKGSRNNGLNLLGSSLTNVINGAESLFKVGQKIGSTFSEGFSEAEEGASFFTKVLGGLTKTGEEAGSAAGEAFTKILAAGPGAAVAIAAVGAAAVVLVTVLGALLGIVTALAASLLTALTGAALVAGGALGALGVAAGLLVAAFTSLSDAQKSVLAADFAPLKDEFTGLGQAVLTGLLPYMAQISTNLQNALALAGPLASVMGTVFGQVGASITKAFSGPGFQLLFSALQQQLPSIITSLGSAFGSLLNGIAGSLAAILPSVNTFAGYLASVAARFAAFATSAKGQNQIADFMDRAVTAIKSVFGFLRELGGLIADVLYSPQANGAGNSLLDSISKSINNARKAISGNKLSEWMADAVKFGKALGKVMQALADIFLALYNSGVLSAIAFLLEQFAITIKILAAIIKPLNSALLPLGSLLGAAGSAAKAAIAPFVGLADAAQRALSAIGLANSAASGTASKAGLITPSSLVPGGVTGLSPRAADAMARQSSSSSSVSSLISLGKSAGSSASASSASSSSLGGGSIPSSSGSSPSSSSLGSAATPVDPNALTAAQLAGYQQLADLLTKDGPTIVAQIRKAESDTTKSIEQTLRTARSNSAKTITDALSATDAGSVSDAIKSYAADQIQTVKSSTDSLKTNAKALVTSAQDALNSAASQLGSATTKQEAAKALAAISKAKGDLKSAEAAQKQIKAQAVRTNAAAKAANAIASAQAVSSQDRIDKLVAGQRVANATLADFAAARGVLAQKISDANAKLTEAIKLRDDYASSVSSSIKAFGALTTAQAQTIDGVQQALTATDITTNLQDRLKKIQDFQSNLRILLAQGLSQDAYKQIVDAGVENGSAYATALVQGGQGAVAQVNSLTGQINATADNIGTDSANRLYQAGVDAAQSLVDGLTSIQSNMEAQASLLGQSVTAAIKAALVQGMVAMRPELEYQATTLGNTISKSMKKSLKINSPSRVARDDMGFYGDGLALGLRDQHAKVSSAADRLSRQVAISPSLALAQAQGRVPAAVSGNSPAFRDLIVNTPTEHPEAVAHEVVNEIVGRLP